MQTEQGVNSVYIHAGTNPFDTITQAVKCVLIFFRLSTEIKIETDTLNVPYPECRAVEKHMQTFHHREKKKVSTISILFDQIDLKAFEGPDLLYAGLDALSPPLVP